MLAVLLQIKIINVLLLMVMTVRLCFVFPAYAQEAFVNDDAIDAIQQVQDIGFRYERAKDSLQALDNTVHSTVTSSSESIFMPTNLGLWILSAVLLGFLLLLLAIRRSLRQAGAHRPLVNTVPGSYADDHTLRTPKSSHVRPLVQPVKVVKIKVRKLKKQR